MEVLEAIKRRRSVRSYRADPVDRETILKILDAANWAPSAMDRQQWDFIVVSGAWIARLGKSYKTVVEGTIATGTQASGGPVAYDETFLRFAALYGGAPVVVLVLTDANDDQYTRKANIESASAAMQNLLLAAVDAGLGSCWMTGPLRDEAGLRALLDIPASKEIVALTPLGYPAAPPAERPRRDPTLATKVRWVE